MVQLEVTTSSTRRVLKHHSTPSLRGKPFWNLCSQKTKIYPLQHGRPMRPPASFKMYCGLMSTFSKPATDLKLSEFYFKFRKCGFEFVKHRAADTETLSHTATQSVTTRAHTHTHTYTCRTDARTHARTCDNL